MQAGQAPRPRPRNDCPRCGSRRLDGPVHCDSPTCPWRRCAADGTLWNPLTGAYTTREARDPR